MTSTTILIQRAAELVIEFGLVGTSWTADELRQVAQDTRPAFCVCWHELGVTLGVSQTGGAVRTTVRVEDHAMRPHRASMVVKQAAAVADLAARVEALR